MSLERVILKALNTLTEAAQFARFAESAVRVARNHSTAASIPSKVSSLASEVAGQAVAPAGSHYAAASCRLHVSAVFETLAEVAQSDAEHSILSHARQEVDRSSDNNNNKI